MQKKNKITKKRKYSLREGVLILFQSIKASLRNTHLNSKLVRVIPFIYKSQNIYVVSDYLF